MKLKHTLLLVCLGVGVTPLAAQQLASPKAPDSRAMREKAGRKPVAYLGVLTGPVSPELRSQFSLPEGFGLVVAEVMAGSPAQMAGLKKHDVLLKLDDQRLVNMEQLKALVRSRKNGDTVSLSVITGGKETQIQVILAEHVPPEPEPRRDRQKNFDFRPKAYDLSTECREQLERHAQAMRVHQERVEKWQQEVRAYQERLQDWTQNNRGTPLPQPPLLEMPAPGGRQPPQRRTEGETRRSSQTTESHAAATITRRDESGEYTLRKEDERANFSVRDKDGREQSWPINNEDERKAVPERYQDKLREMEKGVRIERSGRPPGSEDPRQMPPPAEKPASA